MSFILDFTSFFEDNGLDDSIDRFVNRLTKNSMLVVGFVFSAISLVPK